MPRDGKAEVAKSGLAGDSASVALCLIYPADFSLACACRDGAKRRRSRIKTVTCFYGH